MNCPRCQTVNPENAHFCMNCGNPFALTCPNCSTQNPATARFCFNCGHALAPAQAPAPLHQPVSPSSTAPALPELPAAADLQQYMPAEYADKLKQSRLERTMAGDRRIVTILFCDVKGSTAMAERLDPEEWAEIMNDAFQYLISPVYRYEGTVARLMGDAILAFFGAPIAHEDDPQRAVLAALDIVDGLRQFQEQQKSQRGLDFGVRIGIHTGLVVVGEIGSDMRMEYTAMGDAVNLAARMEQTAAANTVQISEDTYRLVAPLFETEALGGIEIKGKSQPIPAYRVTGPRQDPGRRRGLFGLEAPMIGRQGEMQQLDQVLSSLQRGRGQIVFLVGEAGIGKTRLVRELHKSWLQQFGEAAKKNWRSTRSVSYAMAYPYSAFQQLIRKICGASLQDSPAILREKIACECLSQDTPKDICQRVSRAFEVLLGLGDLQAQDPLEGETFRRELYEAMQTTWEDWSSRGPVVLVFDDLHWADRASLDLLGHLFRLVENKPVLFLLTMRPDRAAPAWQLRSTAQSDYPHRTLELNLSPLTTQESEQMVGSLLEISNLPGGLRERILAKTEGNPFFVEEVIRSLIESGAVRQGEGGRFHWQPGSGDAQITIPDTVQALLMARIDRLEEDVRQTLQLAAVIGRTFYYRVLQRISDASGELDRHLNTLEKVDLIRESGRQPEMEYAFRHALTQETVYNSILLKRRRKFHRLVGDTIERLFPDRIEETAAMLAHHFAEASDPRAAHYYTLAGDQAYRLFAISEATEFYRRALTLSASLPEANVRYLYERLGRSLELDGRFEEAIEHYRQMERFAGDQQDQPMLLFALVAQAILRATPTPVHDRDEAVRLCDHALTLALAVQDRVSEARIYWALSLLNARVGRPEDSVLYGEKSLAISKELGLEELVAYALNDVSQGYIAIGEYQKAREGLAEAGRIFTRLNLLPMVADTYSSATFMDFFAGDYARAIEESREAFRLSHKSGNLWGQAYSYMYVGLAQEELGELSEAIHSLRECLRLSEQAGFLAPMITTRADLGLMLVNLGQVEEGNQLIELALETASEKLPMWKPWVTTTQLRVQIRQKDFESVKAGLDYVAARIEQIDPIGYTRIIYRLARLEYFLGIQDNSAALLAADDLLSFQSAGLRSFVPQAYFGKAQAYFHLGQDDAGFEVLQQARHAAEQLNARRSLWQILAEFAQYYLRQGDVEQATQAHQQARQVLDFLLNHIHEPEYFTSFNNLPEVKAVLSPLKFSSQPTPHGHHDIV